MAYQKDSYKPRRAGLRSAKDSNGGYEETLASLDSRSSSSNAQSLKDQSRSQVGPVKIDLGNGKSTDIDAETQKNWFKLSKEAKDQVKAKIGDDAFNQLKDKLDKQAPQQGIFNKVRDKVDANTEADKFRRLQQGQNEDYRTAQRDAGEKDYTNPFQRVGFTLAEPVARGANTIAGASGKFAQGASDLAGVALASDPEEKRKAKERAIKRGDEDIAFSGKGGLLGVGANFQNAKELEDKKKLAGAAIQTGADLASIIPQSKAAKLGMAGASVGKQLGVNVAENIVTGVGSEAGRQLKEGKFDPKAFGKEALIDAAMPVGLYGAGRIVRGGSGGVDQVFTSGSKSALAELNKAKANRIIEMGKNAPETDTAFLLDAKNPTKLPKEGNLSKTTLPAEQGVIQLTDADYTKRFNELSKSYDKATKELANKGPLAQKITAEELDNYHLQELEKLDNDFVNGIPIEGAKGAQTIETGFTRPEVVDTPKTKLNAAQVKASKRIAQIDKITAQVQKNGVGKYKPDELRGLLRERSDAKAILESPSGIKAPTEAPRAPGTHLDSLPDEGGTIGYKTMASLSRDSKLANLDKTLYDNLKYSVKGLGGGKVGSGLERVAKMFDSEQAVNSELKHLEYQGKVAKGTADATRNAFSDYKRAAAASDIKLRNSEPLMATTASIRERAKDFGGDIRAAQKDTMEFTKASTELQLQKLYDETGGKTGRNFSPEQRANFEAQMAKYDSPQARQADAGINQVYKDMLKEDLDRGYRTQAEYDTLSSLPYDYKRVQREVADWERELGNQGSMSSKPGRIQKRVENTDKAQLDPLETLVAYSQQREAAHLKNVYKEQVLGALQEGGEAKLITKGSKADGPEISVRRNGVDEKYQVDPEIAKVLEHTDKTEMGAIVNAARAANNIFKYGTTGGNVGFALRNIFVDIPSAVINSEAGLRVLGPMNLMSSYGKALGVPDKFLGKMNKELWNDYKENVGTGATRIQQYDKPKSSAKVARDLVSENASLKEKGINVAKNLGEMGNVLRGVDEQIARTEHATRFAVFRSTYNKAIKKMDKQSALELATQASREATTDFLAGGNAAKKLNMFAPYFNPKMQVARTLGRSFEKRPVSTMMKMSATVGIPMIALTLNNTETPEKRAIYDQISEKTKEDYHIYIADDATYDPETKKFTGVTTVRKPNDASGWFNGVRKYIEKSAQDNPEEHATWLGALKDTAGALVDNSPVPVTPSQALNMLPGVAKTYIEDKTNKSLYYGTDLVPETVANSAENPADQHYSNYSRTSKFLGGLLGKSPLVIDNYIRGNLGELGTNAQNLIDRATGGKTDNVDAEGKTYSDVGGRSFGDTVTRGFNAARGGEVTTKFWEAKNAAQKGRDIASKKVTAAVNNGDYAKAQRLAQEYNDSLGTRLTPFLSRYQDTPYWDPEWDTYLEGLFIKDTPRALKSRRKKD